MCLGRQKCVNSWENSSLENLGCQSEDTSQKWIWTRNGFKKIALKNSNGLAPTLMPGHFYAMQTARKWEIQIHTTAPGPISGHKHYHTLYWLPKTPEHREIHKHSYVSYEKK